MRQNINKFLEWTLAILLGIMVLDVFWGVLTRYVMGSQSSWTDELARYLMIWVSILGSAYAAGKNFHIAIDLLPKYLNDKNKKRLDIFIILIIVLFVIAVFMVGGLRYMYISFALGQSSPALHVPIGLVYMVLPISGLFIIYYKVEDLYNIVRKTEKQ